MNCRHCGSGNVGYWGSTAWVRCDECGTMYLEGSSDMFVPRRSQPAEVLELPDSEGWWWVWLDSNWRAVSNLGPDSHWGKGKYVRAVPPIIAPEPAAITDADVIRFLQKCYWTSGSMASIEGPRPTDEDVERVVARVSEQSADVKPEVKDADAEMLRQLALYYYGGASTGRLPSAEDLNRIAARLESQAKERGE